MKETEKLTLAIRYPRVDIIVEEDNLHKIAEREGVGFLECISMINDGEIDIVMDYREYVEWYDWDSSNKEITYW